MRDFTHSHLHLYRKDQRTPVWLSSSFLLTSPRKTSEEPAKAPVHPSPYSLPRANEHLRALVGNLLVLKFPIAERWPLPRQTLPRPGHKGPDQ